GSRARTAKRPFRLGSEGSATRGRAARGGVAVTASAARLALVTFGASRLSVSAADRRTASGAPDGGATGESAMVGTSPAATDNVAAGDSNGVVIGVLTVSERRGKHPGRARESPSEPRIVCFPEFICTFRKNLCSGHELEQATNQALEFRRQP